ncbi:hypothetical protein CSPAE12_00429 [Colletotrichum incanum]|nr:hypothetical protein CSPAE12_00429 [Colletotrichum incanum]
MQIDQLDIAMRVNDKLDELANLSAAKRASFDSYDDEPEQRFYPHTRKDLLRQIAGTAKSTISRTVAHAFAKRKQLAASFFFNRTRDGRNGVRLFVTTIAKRLARVPSLRGPITAAIHEDPDLPDKGLQLQFEKLIIEPLQQLKSDGVSRPALVLVVDALDEFSVETNANSGTQVDRNRLLVKLLARTAATTGVMVRMFLTSRPELPVTLGFRDVPEESHNDVLLQNILNAIIEHDIRVFINRQFEEIRRATA